MPFHTPDAPPAGDYICWRLRFPRTMQFMSLVNAALKELLSVRNYEKTGTLEAYQVVEIFTEMWANRRLDACMIGQVYYSVRETPDAISLLCDGSEHNRVDYPELYAVLPSGLITDADHFRTPDLRGKTPIGVGTGIDLTERLMLDTGGQETVQLSIDHVEEHYFTIPSHGHTTVPHTHIDTGHTHPAATFGIDIETIGADLPVPVPEEVAGLTGIGHAQIQNTTVIVNDAPAIETNHLGEGVPHENMMPFLALNAFIVAK